MLRSPELLKSICQNTSTIRCGLIRQPVRKCRLRGSRGEVFSRDTPDKLHDWVLQVPREGHKEAMARSYYFESQDPPVQEVESDSAKIPYEISDPPGDSLSAHIPTPFKVKPTRTVRGTRTMQYVWWGGSGCGWGRNPRAGDW